MNSPFRLRRKWLLTVSAMFVTFMSPLSALACTTINNVEVTAYGFMLSSSATYRVGGTQPYAAGSFKSGNLDDLTKYVETACVPVIFTVKNTSNSTRDIQASPWFEYNGGGKLGFTDLELITTTATVSGIPGNITNLNQMKFPGTLFKTATSFKTTANATINATVTGPFSGKSMGTSAAVANDGFRHYNVTLKNVPKNGTVLLMTCGRLAENANLFGGGNITEGIAIPGSNDADHVDVITSGVLNLPTLTLEKDLVNVPTGTYTYTITPAINGVSSTFSLLPGQSTLVIPNVLPSGPFKVTEAGPSGYVFGVGTGTNCTFAATIATASPAPGVIPTNAKCVFTDKLEPVNGKLTVTKVVINDNGGTKTLSDFPLLVNGVTVTSGVQNTYEPGEYQVSEPQDPAYTATFSGDCDANGNVLLTAGSVKSCTVTNNDRPSTIIVTTNITNDNGGTLTVADFPATLNGNPVVSGAENTVNPGAHVVTQTNRPGYTTTFSGACNASGNITVVAGTANECVITNDDNATLLTVTSSVINDNGGTLTVANFPLTLDAAPVNSGEIQIVTPGAHAVSVGSQTGYAVTFSGACNASGNVTATLGSTSTCTVTIDDIAPKLTVSMVIVNDQGGANVVQDFFPILVNDNSVNLGEETSLMSGSYAITQTEDPGYILSFSGDCDFNGNITLGIGDVKNCVIKNNDLPVGLTIVTKVINDNGGTAVPSDFTTFIQGVGVPFTIFMGNNEGVSIDLGAGPYNVGQVLLDGYDAFFSSGCFGFINEGERLVCTITNVDM